MRKKQEIVSREELLELGKPRTEFLPIPELGEGRGVRVTGYTCADLGAIQRAAFVVGPDGKDHYDPKADRMWSLYYAIAEPKMEFGDIARMEGLATGIADLILSKAQELSGRTQNNFDELKSMFRKNAYARRLFTICAQVFGRFPSELDSVTEQEFIEYLAAAEVEAELIQETSRKGQQLE